MDPQQMWNLVLAELEVSLSKANFGMWFRDTFIAEDNGDTIVIGVPNTFYLDWIRGKYHKNIADTLRKLRPTIRDISYKVASRTVAPPVELKAESYEPPVEISDSYREALTAPITLPLNNEPTHSTQAPQFPENTGFQSAMANQEMPVQPGHNPLDPNRVFETFIVGNSNRLAHAVSLAAAQEPGKKYNPLFLYGGVGLGKTHLAQAIGNEIRRQNPGARITYVSCETFTNEFIDALRKNQMESFKKRYRQTDALLIDDIQFMSGKAGIQEEFFHTFNALHQTKKQIVLTADQEPQNIKGLEERLTSRFAWGMVADIQAPDYETRVAILRAKCQEHQYSLSSETLDTLAQVVQSNIRELEGALQRLITQANIEGQVPTPEYVTRIFSSVAGATRSRTLNAERIINVVSEYFELKPDEITGARRYKELVYPRQLTMYLIRHELNYSYPKIGKELGGKDHTTIMHGVEKIEKEIARNSNMQYDLGQLKERLHQL